jgi:hypothetical protein
MRMSAGIVARFMRASSQKIKTVSNTFLFIYTKLYHLFRQPDPVASPQAHFVSVPTNPPALASRPPTHAWNVFLVFWSFLLGPEAVHTADARVQELEVWTPSEGEFMLFSVYPPLSCVFVDAVDRG